MTKACDTVPDDNIEPYMFRSQCYTKLGLYDEADIDADSVLGICPVSVKGLINKAETQYNLGRFEHSMKYFYR